MATYPVTIVSTEPEATMPAYLADTLFAVLINGGRIAVAGVLIILAALAFVVFAVWVFLAGGWALTHRLAPRSALFQWFDGYAHVWRLDDPTPPRSPIEYAILTYMLTNGRQTRANLHARFGDRYARSAINAALDRLTDTGALAPRWRDIGRQRERVYALTPDGYAELERSRHNDPYGPESHLRPFDTVSRISTR